MTPRRKRSPDTRSGDRHRRSPRPVRLPTDVDAALVARAKTEGRPPNALIVDAVRAWLATPAD